MEDYVKRMVEEQGELSDRIVKLHRFIHGEMFLSLSKCEQEQLKIQFYYMLSYSSVLCTRIVWELRKERFKDIDKDFLGEVPEAEKQDLYRTLSHSHEADKNEVQKTYEELNGSTVYSSRNCDKCPLSEMDCKKLILVGGGHICVFKK